MKFPIAQILPMLLRRVYFTVNSNQYRSIYSQCISKRRIPSISPLGNLLRYSDCPPKCWQCDYPQKSELFCSKCKAVQKLPGDLNYFDIIGVPKDFDVNLNDVQIKYRQLQNLLHPDRFGQKSDVIKYF